MGSLFRFPYLPESFSLPSLPQLRSPNPPPVHRHLVPRPLKTPSSSASLSSLLEGFPPTRSDFNYPIFETGQQPSAEQADRGETFDPRPKKIFKNCSLCHDPIPNGVEPCTFPRTAPAALAALTPHLPLSIEPKIFCHACWVWIHNLSICWICGETVSRKEERVSYGWCWWHWGCVSCLLCRTPLPPPPWTDNPGGIHLLNLPLCKYCIEDLVLLEDEATLETPRSPSPKPAAPPRSVPKWMKNLPSNRNKNEPSPSRPAHTLIPSFSRSTTGLSIDSRSRSTVGLFSSQSSLHKTSGDETSASAAVKAMESLNRRYGGRTPPYIRELSALFSDSEKQGQQDKDRWPWAEEGCCDSS